MPQTALFIPKVYSAQTLQKLDASLVAGAITNRNYLGEITRKGDQVEVYAVGDLTVNDHVRNQPISFQNPGGGTVMMDIDQEKDCSFLVDNVDAFQSNINVQTAYQGRQVRAMAEDVDTHVLGKYGDAHADNVIATTAATASGFIKVVRDAKVALSEKNVPRDQERFLAIPPFYASLLSEYFSETQQNEMAAVQGYIGRLEGFNVLESNRLVENTGKVKCMFGHTAAITLARQIINTEWWASHPSYHGGAMKGLMVYGSKTFLPEALGLIDADIPA